MSTHTPDVSPWTFERPFRFVSSRPLEDVLGSLSQLEQNSASGTPQPGVSFMPTDNGYTFSYRVTRHRRKDLATVIFPSEGRIWQDDDGNVIMKGTAQVDVALFYISILISFMFYIIPGIIHPSSRLFVAPLFLFLIIWTLWHEYRTRDRVVNCIQQAVTAGEKTYSSEKMKHTLMSEKEKHVLLAEKDKHAPIPEKVKTSTIAEESVRTVSLCDSVWNDAISEYETWERN